MQASDHKIGRLPIPSDPAAMAYSRTVGSWSGEPRLGMPSAGRCGRFLVLGVPKHNQVSARIRRRCVRELRVGLTIPYVQRDVGGHPDAREKVRTSADRKSRFARRRIGDPRSTSATESIMRRRTPRCSTSFCNKLSDTVSFQIVAREQ